MSTEAKILLRKLSDESIAYSVVIDDNEIHPHDNRVEIDCMGEVGANALIATLMATGSDVEILPSESINEFAQLHAEPEGNGEKPDPA